MASVAAYLIHYLQEGDVLTDEWVGYFAAAAKGRGKSQLELPPSGDRSKVYQISQQIVHVLNF